MLSNYARYFSQMQVHFTEMIGRLRLERFSMNDAPLSQLAPDDDPNGGGWANWDKNLFWAPFRKACEAIDLDSAVDQIDRMEQDIHPGLKRSELLAMFEELKNRIADQLKNRQFLYVPKSKENYWQNAMLFGEEVFFKIPDALTDVYEAGSCFAVGRAGGTVYHCMGIMQAALFQVGKELGCTIDLELDDWKKVADKIVEALDKRRKIAEAKGKAGDSLAYAKWKKEETAYNELLSDLNAVARAWRHPSAHYRQTYTLEQAEKVLEKVEDFAKHAATLLPNVP